MSAAALAVALAGCTANPAPKIPAGPDRDQIEAGVSVWIAQQLRVAGEPVSDTTYGGFQHWVSDSQFETKENDCFNSMMQSNGFITDANGQLLPPKTGSEYALLAQETYGLCAIQFPPERVKSLILTPAQSDYLYDYYQASLIPCLQSTGVVVQTAPTRAHFWRDIQNSLTVWSPYDRFAGLGAPGGTVKRIISPPKWLLGKCPARPPGV